MISIQVSYTVEINALGEVLEAMNTFLSEVEKNETQTDYKAYRVANTNSFLHIISFVNKEGEEKHRHAAYTEEFVKILYPNCSKKPKFINIERIIHT